MSANPRKSNQTVPSRHDVLEQVKQIVAEHVTMRADDIQDTHALIADLGCDSLDIVEITMEVEEEFDISVPDEAAENIRTVGDIADGVLRLLGA